MITPDNLVRKSTKLLMSTVDNEAVILGVDSGKYFGLNEIGTKIWSIIDNPVRVSELIDSLVELYDEDINVISSHTIEFLSTLLEKSLIELIDEN